MNNILKRDFILAHQKELNRLRGKKKEGGKRVNVEQIELDRVSFSGHPNVLGTHRNTIEVTRDEHISKRADCIIGVRASKGCADLNPQLRSWVKAGRSLEIEIRARFHSFVVIGRGSDNLDLKNETEIVLRRSDYISSRTLALQCSKAACDIPREMISEFQDPLTNGLMIIRSIVEDNSQKSFLWTLPE